MEVIQKQLRNGGRMPGYKGFIPTSYARAQYGKTFAAQNELAAQTLTLPTHGARECDAGKLDRSKSDPMLTLTAPKGCREKIIRNYTVAPVPGYLGYVPSKLAENIIGAGCTKTAQLARAAVEYRTASRKQPSHDWARYNNRAIVGFAAYMPRRSESLFSHTFTATNAYATEVPPFS
eukprot:GEMP01080310.1.p1 GENE.GEMP01080310.1~~GEMP01080310.1.p1  ORF type:complete len:177 (+),score=36.47 GEMP01080310.1:111-641(+)